jgi:hypothetical protein
VGAQLHHASPEPGNAAKPSKDMRRIVFKKSAFNTSVSGALCSSSEVIASAALGGSIRRRVSRNLLYGFGTAGLN